MFAKSVRQNGNEIMVRRFARRSQHNFTCLFLCEIKKSFFNRYIDEMTCS